MSYEYRFFLYITYFSVRRAWIYQRCNQNP